MIAQTTKYAFLTKVQISSLICLHKTIYKSHLLVQNTKKNTYIYICSIINITDGNNYTTFDNLV